MRDLIFRFLLQCISYEINLYLATTCFMWPFFTVAVWPHNLFKGRRVWRCNGVIRFRKWKYIRAGHAAILLVMKGTLIIRKVKSSHLSLVFFIFIRCLFHCESQRKTQTYIEKTEINCQALSSIFIHERSRRKFAIYAVLSRIVNQLWMKLAIYI